MVTDLTAGEVIGFAIVVSEDDGEDGWYPLTPEAVQTEGPGKTSFSTIGRMFTSTGCCCLQTIMVLKKTPQ